MMGGHMQVQDIRLNAGKGIQTEIETGKMPV